jgi:hypothetical protein
LSAGHPFIGGQTLFRFRPEALVGFRLESERLNGSDGGKRFLHGRDHRAFLLMIESRLLIDGAAETANDEIK